MKIDSLNWAILKELQENARRPLTEISKRVGISSPTVSERIQKLEEAGVIEGYHAHLNLKAIGYSLCVYISIKIRFGQVERFEDYIQTVPEVCECLKLTGNDCMLMKAFVKDTEHLEALNRRLSEYGELTTSLLLSKVVDRKVFIEDHLS
ncbi:MAG: Lrp/AsnC family transcriptional regulator [Bacteroidota bacterium]